MPSLHLQISSKTSPQDPKLCQGNPLSEMLRQRLGLPAPRSAVGNIDWRRREKDEHEWVTNSLGFSLRLNKILGFKAEELSLGTL